MIGEAGVVGVADRKACSLCLDVDAHSVMCRRKMNGKAGSKASIQCGFAVGHSNSPASSEHVFPQLPRVSAMPWGTWPDVEKRLRALCLKALKVSGEGVEVRNRFFILLLFPCRILFSSSTSSPYKEI